LRAGDSVTGPMALTKTMRVTLSLHWRNEAELKAFIANPHHENLTHAEFVAKYGPGEAQVNQVKAFLRQQGFHNIQVTSDNLLVSGEAPVSTVQAAFHTSMVNVRTRHGRMAYANATEARIPNALQGVVHEVLGLQNVHRFHVLEPHTLAASETGHNPTDFASIYNAGGTATASSINIGIITQGSMTNVQSDFQSFLSQNGYGSIPMNVVKVDGGGSGTSGDDEWDLDSQDIVGISGGVKALYLYDTASLSTQDLVDDFSKATTDNLVRAVNVSIGGCETGTETNGAATGDNVFQEADSEGMTFSISTGDSGADECGNGGTTPSWPADSEYVVAVGGTDLYTSGSTPGRMKPRGPMAAEAPPPSSRCRAGSRAWARTPVTARVACLTWLSMVTPIQAPSSSSMVRPNRSAAPVCLRLCSWACGRAPWPPIRVSALPRP